MIECQQTHLTCDRLCVARDARPVIHDIDLTIRSDECVTLIGPNGSGKTTLMLAMLGLLKPRQGTITLENHAVHRLSPKARGRWASYVPQLVERIPAFTVFDVVAGGRFPYTQPLEPLSGEDLDIVENAIARAGLKDLANRPINEISGGERQKALIAAAIAQDATVMFLDEPNTALDPGYQVELVRLLQQWHAEKRGLVVISHDLHLPAALGGRVIALKEGRMVADGPVEKILTPERLTMVYDTTFETATTQSGQRILIPHWG